MDSMSDARIAPAGDRVLLIGDISRALLDAAQVSRYPCDVRANIL
jgi:hypothetical protein